MGAATLETGSLTQWGTMGSRRGGGRGEELQGWVWCAKWEAAMKQAEHSTT